MHAWLNNIKDQADVYSLDMDKILMADFKEMYGHDLAISEWAQSNKLIFVVLSE